jgi:hypothetical protein
MSTPDSLNAAGPVDSDLPAALAAHPEWSASPSGRADPVPAWAGPRRGRPGCRTMRCVRSGCQQRCCATRSG